MKDVVNEDIDKNRMNNKNEYQGGAYSVFMFIGLYLRFFILKILGKYKSIKYLSGEECYSAISKKQRFYCLVVGLVSVLLLLTGVVCLAYLIENE